MTDILLQVLAIIAISCELPAKCQETTLQEKPLILRIEEIYKEAKNGEDLFPLRTYYIVCNESGKCRLENHLGKGV